MNSKFLRNKKVCMLCPSFFGYDEAIKYELESFDADVELYDERVFKGILGKSLIRINFNFLVNYFVNKFYEKNLVEKVEDLDYLLIINPETITPDILEKCKKKNPSLKVITYMWDSFNNKRNAHKLIMYSDKYYTFDPIDSKRYHLEFLPLFYTKHYEKVASEKKDLFYRFCFIGTAHSQRFELINKIIKSSINKSFLFFYSPNRFVFFVKKIIFNELQSLKYKDVSFKSMSRASIVEKISRSEIIIDISHPMQNGLTMRTIEMVGAKKKLITTNTHVSSYDFYNRNNILIYEPEKTSISEINEFLDRDFIELPSDIYKKYSINNWVRVLFDS